MGLVPRFTKDDVRKMMKSKFDRINRAIILNLQYLGDECVNLAKSIPKEVGFEDQSGNLRSSIGYIIVSNGRVINSNGFEAKYGTTGGEEGASSGKQFAESLAGKYSSGYALIVVAGMNYAAKLESNGRDVLSSAEHYAEVELPRLMKSLKIKTALL